MHELQMYMEDRIMIRLVNDSKILYSWLCILSWTNWLLQLVQIQHCILLQIPHLSPIMCVGYICSHRRLKTEVLDQLPSKRRQMVCHLYKCGKSTLHSLWLKTTCSPICRSFLTHPWQRERAKSGRKWEKSWTEPGNSRFEWTYTASIASEPEHYCMHALILLCGILIMLWHFVGSWQKGSPASTL